MTDVMKKIMEITQYILIAIGILIAIMFLIPKLIKIDPFVVVSGSMEETIKTGAIAYVNTHIKAEEINVGDVIAFSTGENQVAHRVISINDDGTFTTKGDANDTEDLAPVKFENYKGKIMFSIPYVGKLVSKCQTHTGRFIIFTIVGLSMVNIIFSGIDRRDKGMENLEKNTEKGIAKQ